MNYTLEKRLWTEADFEQMGWHDNLIYRMRLTQDLELDIDYILKWNQPDVEGMPFTFWVAPATLIFPNVQQIYFDLETDFDVHEISDITKAETENGIRWTIMMQQGEISFIAPSYQQFIRQDPSFQYGQTISYQERNGYSLERTTNQENPNTTKPATIAQRKKDVENYEIAKQRVIKKSELEELEKNRTNTRISTKEYLLKKREIEAFLTNCQDILKGTQFEHW